MKVEIWSDVVCPWCYVGKRRFETALEELDQEIEIEWRSFELDPRAPETYEGPVDEALAKKYRVSLGEARKMIENMEEMGRREGLDIDFDRVSSGNTFDAHRLLQFAKTRGLGEEMKERLLEAHFTDGRSVSSRDVLVDLAEDIGFDADEVREMLASEEHAEDVRRDELEAHQIGVRGVPFFLVDGAYGIPGAQLPEVFVQVLRKVAKEEEASTA